MHVKGASDVLRGHGAIVRLVNSLPTPISPIAGIVIASGLVMVNAIAGIALNDGVDELISDLLGEVYLNLHTGVVVTGGTLNSFARMAERGLAVTVPINGAVDVSGIDRIGEIVRPSIRDLMIVDVGQPVVIGREVDVSERFHLEISRGTHLEDG